MKDNQNIKVYYIIGIGRSGTTLLNSLLGAHDKINTLPENYFVTFFYNKFHKKTKFKPSEIKQIHFFILKFDKLQPFIGYDYTANLEDKFFKEDFKGTYFELCCEFFQLFKHKTSWNEDAQIIIDKNPSNTLYLKSLMNLSSDSKFIFITRDYRANILSRIQSIHIRPPSVIYNAIRWNYFMKKAIKFKNNFDDKVITIKYEDLVLNTSQTLDSIFDFLNIENMKIAEKRINEKKAYKIDSQNSNDRLVKKYGDLTKKINSDRIEAWKEELTTDQIHICQLISDKYGERLGYSMIDTANKFSRISILHKVLYTYVKVKKEFFKDSIVFYLPIKLKLNRFFKYVDKIESSRKK